MSIKVIALSQHFSFLFLYYRRTCSPAHFRRILSKIKSAESLRGLLVIAPIMCSMCSANNNVFIVNSGFKGLVWENGFGANLARNISAALNCSHCSKWHCLKRESGAVGISDLRTRTGCGFESFVHFSAKVCDGKQKLSYNFRPVIRPNGTQLCSNHFCL